MLSIRSLHGSAQLLLDVAGGITHITERTHRTIAREVNPLNRLRDIAGVPTDEREGYSYRIIQSAMSSLQHGLHRSLDGFSDSEAPAHSPMSEKASSALNGLCGDHLEATGNPLAISMHFRNSEGAKVEPGSERFEKQIADARSRVVVLVHGLCLSHEYWKGDDATDLGIKLQRAHGFTPLYLNYNSGRHISSNGQEFSEQLQRLVESWPVKIEELVLIGHSMGGLVIRSACWYANERDLAWARLLKKALYLGSPHHGAALAKAGHLLTFVMHKFRYASPFALAQHTSAGIKDLRFGNLLDEDWSGINQDQYHPDRRKPVPLHAGARHYFLAAAVGKSTTDISSTLLGDLLVRLDSARGRHAYYSKRLQVRAENCRVFKKLSHVALLDNHVVHEQILEWLADAGIELSQLKN